MISGDVTIPEQLWKKDYKVLIVILSIFEIIHVREDVGEVGGTRKIFKDEPEVLENLYPSCLATDKLLRGFLVLKVFVIDTYLDLVDSSFEIVTLFFKDMNDSKEFTIIDIIVAFSQVETFGVEGAGVPLSIFWLFD